MTNTPANPQYSMVIEWSDEDNLYVVSFPEWAAIGYISHTHGTTYEEAAEAGTDLLAFLIESARAEGEALPPVRTFAGVQRLGARKRQPWPRGSAGSAFRIECIWRPTDICQVIICTEEEHVQ